MGVPALTADRSGGGLAWSSPASRTLFKSPSLGWAVSSVPGGWPRRLLGFNDVAADRQPSPSSGVRSKSQSQVVKPPEVSAPSAVGRVSQNPEGGAADFFAAQRPPALAVDLLRGWNSAGGPQLLPWRSGRGPPPGDVRPPFAEVCPPSLDSSTAVLQRSALIPRPPGAS